MHIILPQLTIQTADHEQNESQRNPELNFATSSSKLPNGAIYQG